MKSLIDQIKHLGFLVISLLIINHVLKIDPEILTGSLWGKSTLFWLYFSLIIPVVHQYYVLICWRLELYHQTISKTFCAIGFLYYKIGFAILILLRPVSILFLAISNKNSLDIKPILSYGLCIILLIPASYLFYSVKKYFGMDRAFGIDHFKPQEANNMPIVRQGIFKYTSNGMYVFGFLILWCFGFALLSKAALLIALFNHVYIWIHYFYTEEPDMKYIYGTKKLYE